MIEIDVMILDLTNVVLITDISGGLVAKAHMVKICFHMSYRPVFTPEISDGNKTFLGHPILCNIYLHHRDFIGIYRRLSLTAIQVIRTSRYS